MNKDFLDVWLQSFTINGGVFSQCLFGPSFGLTIESSEAQLLFHVITEGECTLRWQLDNQAQHALLKTGDMVLLKGNVMHTLASSLAYAVTPMHLNRDYLERFNEHNEGGTACCVLCGYFDVEPSQLTHLLNEFPAIIVLRNDHNTRQLQHLLSVINNEIQHAQSGSMSLVSRLTQAMFLYVLRACVQQRPESTGLLAAATDSIVSQALTNMHQFPHKAWTVASLAAASHSSRANFSRRFSQLLQASPIEYLTKIRTEKAAQQLLHTSLSVSQIAESMGYSTEASFSKAFKKNFGVTPAKYRKG